MKILVPLMDQGEFRNLFSSPSMLRKEKEVVAAKGWEGRVAGGEEVNKCCAIKAKRDSRRVRSR